MMRLLLILISLLSLKANSTEYFEYTVKPGDTLSQISLDFSLNLEDVYYANKTLGFNPNKIEIGQKIIIPFPNKPQRCPTGASLAESIVIKESSQGFYYQQAKDSYFSSLDELFSYCVEIDKFQTLIQATYDEAKELILSDKAYQQALMLYIYSGVFTFDVENNSKPKSLYCDSLLNGIEDFLSITSWLNISGCNFSRQEIENSKLMKPAKNAMLFSLRYTDLEAGSSVNYWLLPTKFRFEFLMDLIRNMAGKSNEKFSELMNDARRTLIEHFSLNPFTVDQSFLINVTSYGYYALNHNHELLGLSTFEELRKFVCNQCDFNEMRMLLLDGMINEDLVKKINDSSITRVLESIETRNLGHLLHMDTVLYLLYANYLGNYSHFIGENEVIQAREVMIEELKGNLSRLEQNEFPEYWIKEAKRTLSIYYGDLAVDAAQSGKCDFASDRLKNAFTYYAEDEDTSDTFREPLQISNCYLREGNFAKAKDFMRLALETSKDRILLNTYYKSMAILAEGFLNDKANNYIDEAQNELLFSQNFQGTTNDFEVVLEMLFLLEKKLNTGSIDFIKLKNKYNSISSSDKLTKARIFAGNQNLLELQQDLVKTSKAINDLELNLFTDQKADKENLIMLYEQKKNIIESIYSQSEKMDSLYGNVFSSQNELMDKIPSNTKVLSYFIFDRSAWALIFSNDAVDFVDLKTTSGSLFVKNKILSDSIGTEMNFNFSKANELYNLIFKKIEKYFDSGSTIYIYDSDNIRLPLSVLVRSIPKESNYEKSLIEADWLIRDYAFAYIYPSKIEQKSYKFTEKFLGLANATSYSWAELPTLKSSIKEVQNLALSSNGKRENILINEDASKENFLNKIESNYERIVIATHAVPEDWKGYTSESALILSSNKSDYFLTSSEIAQLDFKADMVVLSSCSGMTQDFRDLFKSFLVAGANSVVHANWNLESKFATEFTDQFFKELWLEKDIMKHEAMRNVALSFLDDYSNPMYADPAFWGNFSIGYSSL